MHWSPLCRILQFIPYTLSLLKTEIQSTRWRVVSDFRCSPRFCLITSKKLVLIVMVALTDVILPLVLILILSRLVAGKTLHVSAKCRWRLVEKQVMVSLYLSEVLSFHHLRPFYSLVLAVPFSSFTSRGTLVGLGGSVVELSL